MNPNCAGLVNVGVDEIEFDNDYQKIMRTVEYITNDGFIIDEEGTEVGLDDLDIIELGFILDELEENMKSNFDKSQIFIDPSYEVFYSDKWVSSHRIP